jgi:hypothetical protein
MHSPRPAASAPLALLLLAISGRAATTSDRIPRWTMPLAQQPNVSLPLNGSLPAGLKLLPGTTHVTVFEPSHTACCTTAVPPCPRSAACLGTYNHGPLIGRIGGGLLMMGWRGEKTRLFLHAGNQLPKIWDRDPLTISVRKTPSFASLY